MSMKNRIRTEHAGAKNGLSSYYGKRAEAKHVCKRMRRRIAKEIIANELRSWAWSLSDR